MLNNLTIRTKFALPLIFLTTLFVVMGINSFNNSQSLSTDVEDVSEIFLQAISVTLNADRDLYQAQVAMQNFIIMSQVNNPAAADEIENFEENAKQALDRMHQAMGLMADYPDMSRRVSGFDQDYDKWHKLSEQVFDQAKSGNYDRAAVLSAGDVVTQFEKTREHYNVFGEQVETIAKQVTEEALSSASQAAVVQMVLFCVVLALGIVSIMFGPSLVTNRVNELNKVIASISEGDGDLTGRLDTSGKDELSTLARTFNGLMDKLQNLIQLIRADVQTLGTSSVSLNGSAERSHSVTNDQGANLEQIAAAVDEMTEALREVASNSQVALEDTKEAKSKIKDSDDVVNESVLRIQQLSESIRHASNVIEELVNESNNIVKVLDVIRDIAEQTNLLALNAAIEAARAGEQGRGFAVVADEVRTLASRTQQSTEDIQGMVGGLEKGVQEAVSAIQTGNTEVDTVVSLSERVKESLQEIDNSALRTNEMISEIATATEQQSLVIGDVAKSLAVLNDLSQHNIDISENTRQESENLEKIANGLNTLVGRFRV